MAGKAQSEVMGAKLKALRSLCGVEAGDCAKVARTSLRNWYRWEAKLPWSRFTRSFKAVRRCELDQRGGSQLHMGF